MAGQAYDKDAGTHTDRVVDNTMAGSEGKVLKEVNETPPKERLGIIGGAEGKGQDVPKGFKSADGSDATVVQHKQERVEKTYEDKVVQVGAVQVRDMAPGVDSMAAVKVNVRETTAKTTTEVTEKPGPAQSGDLRGYGDAAIGGRGAGREGGREAGKEGGAEAGAEAGKEGHAGREGERAGAAEAAEGKGKEDGKEGHEGERAGEAEAAEGKGRESAEAAEQAGKAQEVAGESGREGADANRAAAERAAEAAGAGGKLADFQSGSGGDAQDRHRNPHKRK